MASVMGSIANKKSLRLRLVASTRLTEATVKQVELATKFKPKEIRKLYQQFQQIADRDGTLGQHGFRQSMGILGMVQDSILCQRLFSVFNKSQTGYITFEEFAIGLGVLVKGSVDEKLEFAFAMTDIDSSGEITLGELEITVDSIMRIYSGIMGSVNIATLDKSKIRKMFNQLDRNRDGMITLDEYKRGMKQHPEFVASLRGSDLFTVGQNNIIKEGQSRVRRYRRVCKSVMLDVNEAIQLVDAISIGIANANISNDEPARAAAAHVTGLDAVPLTRPSRHLASSSRGSVASESTVLSDEIDTEWESADDFDEYDDDDEDEAHGETDTYGQAASATKLGGSSIGGGSSSECGPEQSSDCGAGFIRPLGDKAVRPLRLNTESIASGENVGKQGAGPTGGLDLPEDMPLDDRLMSVLLTIQAKMQAVLEDTSSKKKRAAASGATGDIPGVAVPPGANLHVKRYGMGRAGSATELRPRKSGSSDFGAAEANGGTVQTRQARSSTESEITTRSRDFVVDQKLIKETLLNSPTASGGARHNQWSKMAKGSRYSSSTSNGRQASEGGGDLGASKDSRDRSKSASQGRDKASNGNGDVDFSGNDDDDGDDVDDDDGNNSHVDDAALGRYLASAQKGSTVFFGHKNWDLVINVMKGIQMAVGRSAAEASRPLNQVDFSVKEKYTLVAGSKIGKHASPKNVGLKDIDNDRSGRSCRFVDYAPVVYCKLREHFGIRNEDYVHSIGPGNMLSNLMLGSLSSLAELGSEGKSGSFFYFTSDGQFMVKTVHKEEHKLLRSILPQYYYHMTRNGSADSLLCRIVGSHVVRLSKNSKIGANKIYFVVMTNMLHTDLKLDLRYDLKGSWVGRKEGEAARKLAKSTLKDVDFREMNQRIRIGPERKARLMEALRRDAAFLEDKHIIDYSLLLGIHKRPPPTQQQQQRPDGTGSLPSIPSSASRASASNMFGRRFSITSDGEDDDGDEDGAVSCRIPFFQEDEGGMSSEDGTETYVMGVIDFFTLYTSRKVVERFGKAFVYSREGISVAPPHKYAKRFIDYMDKSIE